MNAEEKYELTKIVFILPFTVVGLLLYFKSLGCDTIGEIFEFLKYAMKH